MSRPSKHSSAGPQLAERNLHFGWWSLLIFLSLGAVLETLQGFKIGWYVDVGNETRRLMFTLAHAHGTLLAVVNIAAGLTVRIVDRFTLRPSVSVALIWAAILLPAGFFLGGIVSGRHYCSTALRVSRWIYPTVNKSPLYPARAIEGAILNWFADLAVSSARLLP
ncbi:MAG: hypothetical protein DMF24_05445 [Verrucomicrobia bacterium]|nr:MAG: hypothetical protein DMF24_05445 [Verrucomicrobiota bacterium]